MPNICFQVLQVPKEQRVEQMKNQQRVSDKSPISLKISHKKFSNKENVELKSEDLSNFAGSVKCQTASDFLLYLPNVKRKQTNKQT